MPNPFYTQTQFSNYKNIYNMLANSKNPQQLFAAMAQNNPQLKPIVNMLNQGMNPQTIFNTMCEQRGINPQEFLKNITG
jgi:hypothetical protein